MKMHFPTLIDYYCKICKIYRGNSFYKYNVFALKITHIIIIKLIRFSTYN